MSNGGLSAASSNVAETVLVSLRLKIPKIRGKTIAAARYRFQLLGAARSTALPQRKMVRALVFAFVYWCLTFVPVAEALPPSISSFSLWLNLSGKNVLHAASAT